MMPAPTATISKLQVFLSYRSVEARFADVLKEHLQHDFIGLVEVFLASDTTSVAAGTLWLDEVVAGLKRSQLHIVICSKTSVQCPWINYEVGAAGVRGIPIIPLCHSGLVHDQLPVPLCLSQGGILTEASGLQIVYQRIAGLIGSAVPTVDFAKYAAELAEVEAQSKEQSKVLMTSEDAGVGRADEATGGPEFELIEDPKVLCVTSPQFRELGYENQLQMVLGAFPKTIRHQFVLSSADLKKVLLEEHVDIIHIAAFVCPRGGDLYFSRVELPLGKAGGEELDRMPADVLVSLVRKANTRLVVLGASASLVLGAQLVPVTNVIAARDLVSAIALASWVETFYKTLANETLAAAFKLASEVSQAPMKLYAQQRHDPALAFTT